MPSPQLPTNHPPKYINPAKPSNHNNHPHCSGSSIVNPKSQNPTKTLYLTFYLQEYEANIDTLYNRNFVPNLTSFLDSPFLVTNMMYFWLNET